MLDLVKSNHLPNTSKLWLSIFGFVTAAFFSYTFVSLYLAYHRCPWLTVTSLVLTLISLFGTILFQRYVQRQRHVSIRDWYRYAIGNADSGRYLGFAIRHEHRHCAPFKVWIDGVLESQRIFIMETRQLLHHLCCPNACITPAPATAIPAPPPPTPVVVAARPNTK